MSSTQDPASPEYGAKLARAATAVIDAVRAGATPTGALTDVARSNNLSAVEIQRVGETYNKVATLHHLENAVGEKRADVFDLADTGAACDAIFSPAVKKASTTRTQVPDFFALRPPAPAPTSPPAPTMQKAASAPAAPPATQADVLAMSMQFELQIKEAAKVISRDFKDTPFHLIEQLMHVRYGEKIASFLAPALFEESAARRHGQRRATVREINYSAAPNAVFFGNKLATIEGVFSTVKDYMAAASRLSPPTTKSASLYDLVMEESQPASRTPFVDAVTTSEVCQPFQPPAEPDWQPFQKGSAFMPMTTGLLGVVSDKVKDHMAADTRATDKQRIQADMSTQSFDDQISEIRAQAAINQMFTDDVISGYDPEEVAEAVNEIGRLSPAILTDPSLLRAQVRQRLASGGTAPFDLAAQMKQEEALRSQFGHARANTLAAPAGRANAQP